jgi:hypothetical protein
LILNLKEIDVKINEKREKKKEKKKVVSAKLEV